jgi:hypothetical protein
MTKLENQWFIRCIFWLGLSKGLRYSLIILGNCFDAFKYKTMECSWRNKRIVDRANILCQCYSIVSVMALSSFSRTIGLLRRSCRPVA